MPYSPGRPPELDNLAELREYVLRELDKIAESQVEITEVELRKVHKEPARPRQGMSAYADGTDWDPGEGEGLYTYSSGGWRATNAIATLGIVSLRHFGTSADVQAAVTAAIAAGHRRLLLPAGWTWIPTANTTPPDLTVIGEDWETSIISSADTANDHLLMGARSRWLNVGTRSKFGTDIPPSGSKVVPVANAFNSTQDDKVFQVYLRTPLFGWIGESVAPGGVTTTTETNFAIVLSQSSGGAFYIDNGFFGYGFDIVNTNTSALGSGIGVLIRNGYVNAPGSESGGHMGIKIHQFGDGSAPQYGIFFDREGDESASTVVVDSNASGTLANPIHQYILEHQGGDIFQIFHTNSTLSGTVLKANMAVGGGTFSGAFIDFLVNSGRRFAVDAGGNTSAGSFLGLFGPDTQPMLSAAGCTVSIANGASAALTFATGVVIVTEQTANGSLAIYLNGTGGCVLVATSSGFWVAPTTTPGAGTASVQASGGVLNIYNNRGGTSNFNVLAMRLA